MVNKLIMIGRNEIPKYSECELNEMSTKKCPAYSVDEGYNCNTQGFFIR